MVVATFLNVLLIFLPTLRNRLYSLFYTKNSKFIRSNFHMAQVVSLHICTDRPQELGEFYRKLLEIEPAWSSEEMIGFMMGNFRLEIMGHSEVSGLNKQPQRLFFDLEVADVRVEFERIVGLGATAVKAPHDYADEEVSFTLATLADIDGNYFQLVSMN
jgi:predicted enzyme related to lactoylglutathione lyase